ncbi:MAG: phosphate/phosphite/phosphonate ABC transporter substrate-binding protein [Candidatus Riflebacteria bacterium]|nr:phosphate/phosphite/phosphonate ABC transporter substrate-binding protein [Candidatus Riflebacteria bacterium]
MFQILNQIRKPLLLVTIIFSMAIFSGCGGGAGDSKSDKTGKTNTQVDGKTLDSSASKFKDVVIKVGRIPFSNSSDLVRQHEGLMKYLKDTLGVKEARLVTASNYDGILQKLDRGEIDIGWLGTQAYVEGKEKFKLKPLVKPVRFGTTSYRGIIIARGDSGIKRLSDLKGKKFAWVEKESASGYIFPKAILIEAGINPDKDFSEAAFLTKHDAVVLNVLLGKYDAGACYDDARKTLKDQEKARELTILGTTQDISNEPLVCRADLPDDLTAMIKDAFLKLSINNPLHKAILQPCTDVQGFVPANDADYEYVRKVYRLLSK